MILQSVKSSVVYAFLLFGCGHALHAQNASLVFDHSTQTDKQVETNVEPGDRIEVTINNTCPDRFNYAQHAFERVASGGAPAGGAGAQANNSNCGAAKAREALVAAGYCVMQSQTLSWVHESKNAAYEVSVAPKQGGAIRGLQKAQLDAALATVAAGPATCAIPNDTETKSIELKAASYLVSVETSPWALGMSGGLSISDVVDPRFAVVNDPASTTTPPSSIVIRDKGAEDSQKLGFAGFLHVHNEKWKLGDIPIAGTFGLGIAEENSISGFVGISAAAFDLAYLTIGWNWSSIDRLPAGQRLNAPPISDNVLNDLPSKTDDGWFIGISFRLMSPGDSFFKAKIPVAPKVDPQTK